MSPQNKVKTMSERKVKRNVVNYLSIDGEFFRLKIKTETFLGCGTKIHGLDLGLENRGRSSRTLEVGVRILKCMLRSVGSHC